MTTIGIITLLIAGICQGSFGLGFKKYAPLSWEAFYFVCSILFGAIPFLWLCIQVPGFFNIFNGADETYLIVPVLCGVFWGFTSIGFSKGVDYIGMSLVYGISMGISTVVGSITPMIVKHSYPEPFQFSLLIIGLLITLGAIIVITKAGLVKEAECSDSSHQTNKGNMKTGLILATISGFGSGAMNIGFDYTSSLAQGLTYTKASAVQWILVLIGGSIASALYCMFYLTKNKTWNTFTKPGAPFEISKLIITCIVWFVALFAYGTAANMLGDMGSVIGWIIFNALALLISNGWGLKTGEWNGAISGKKLLFLGNFILILSWIFVGLSNI